MRNCLSKNLKYLRKRKGLKQTEMQRCIGFSRTTWSNYETGGTEPSVEGLLKISRFFGISLDVLVTQDLAGPEELIRKHPGRKITTYTTNDATSTAKEGDWNFVAEEIAKLWAAVNAIRDASKK